MYCKACEAAVRRGLRPRPDCPDCRRLASVTEETIVPQIPGIPPHRLVPKTGEDRLHGHLVCAVCRRLLLPDAARTVSGNVLCFTCYERLPVCTGCGVRLLESELYECDGATFCETCYDRLDECELCGNKVFRFDENALALLCSECRETHGVCDVCGAIVPKAELTDAEGHPVCSTCASEMDECEDCGKLVFSLPGEPHPRLCSACLSDYATCRVCGEPIPIQDKDRYVVDGKILCENCYDDLPECEECFTRFFPVKGEERGETVCPTCRNNYTRCEECGRRIRFTDAYDIDGRILCEECRSALPDPE